MLGEAPDAGRFGERKRALSACPDGILELVPDVVASQHARWRCPAGKHVCVVAGFHEQSQRERLREEGGERRDRFGEVEMARVSAKTKQLEVVGRGRWKGRRMGRGQSEGCCGAEALVQRRAGSQLLRAQARVPERKHTGGAERVWV